jgi:ABC-type uncharacterized transport system substrate-binding protein
MKRLRTVASAVPALLAIAPTYQCADRTVRTGISLILEHPGPDAARKGFMDCVHEHDADSRCKLEFIHKNDRNNSAVSGQIAKSAVGDKVIRIAKRYVRYSGQESASSLRPTGQNFWQTL